MTREDIKAIPLYKVKEFEKEVENKYDDLANSWDERAQGKNEMVAEVLEMIDRLLGMAIKSLEQEPKTGHWIPISGRPPEDTGYYLTTTIYGEVYCDYWTGSRFDRQETVIAWMPLPQPYKAESEDM